jgi:phosphoglycerate kinase
MFIRTLGDLNLDRKRVIIREDLNVPIQNKTVTSVARIVAAVPTLKYALAQNAAVIVLSHLGRPQEGRVTPELSLAPVAKLLEKLLDHKVRFVTDWLEGVSVEPGEIVLCENVRFNVGEKSNDPNLARKIAKLGDIFVMDAFATTHRSEASTVGIAQFVPEVCAGFLLDAELKALSKVLENPKRPLVAIVGGSKVSTKLSVLSHLLNRVDVLIVGGGIANTFLAAQGYFVGNSLYEKELVPQAQMLLQQAHRLGKTILIPQDVVIAKECTAQASTQIKDLSEIVDDDMILDIGPRSIKRNDDCLKTAGTILWNGPVGVFEMKPFASGTKALSDSVAASGAFSVAGGGDTLAAIELFNVAEKISYCSTAGGAFLEFLEGKLLPGIEILIQ